MQFNHPEVLYALFLLIIPVIIHLFQLRKFQKESFTNVKFLKRLTRQTRKSSRLKKWLVLLTRILLLTCIILAFARPYFPETATETTGVETIVYLDNSYSMQATGQRGPLLNRSVQELIAQLPEDREISVLTNDDLYSNITRQELQEIEYSAARLDLTTILLRAQSRFSQSNTEKNLLIISDFQEPVDFSEIPEPGKINVHLYPLKPQNQNNISIDTVYLEREGVDLNRLTVSLSFTGNNPGNVPVSLYNKDRLLGKNSIDFANTEYTTISFRVEEPVIAEGRLEIEDNGLQFDNILYFSINETKAITVTSINGSGIDDTYLQRIFTSPDFLYTGMPHNEINYNTLTNAEVIVLNEVEDITSSLAATLAEKNTEDAVLIIIPAAQSIGANLTDFIQTLGFPLLAGRNEGEKLISEITFQHPLFSSVFEEEIRNFDYPAVQVSYELSSRSPAILGFANQRAFLTQAGNNFLFTAPINLDNSNFIRSPLVVPTFYNMGATALQPVMLYYNLNMRNSIEVPVVIPQDRILQVGEGTGSFIPQQQRFSNKVEIITEELPHQPGSFYIYNRESPVMALSFNVPRTESRMDFAALPTNDNINVVDDLQQFFDSQGYRNQMDTLWKWFVIFAILFLIIETLLLKYFK